MSVSSKIDSRGSVELPADPIFRVAYLLIVKNIYRSSVMLIITTIKIGVILAFSVPNYLYYFCIDMVMVVMVRVKLGFGLG